MRTLMILGENSFVAIKRTVFESQCSIELRSPAKFNPSWEHAIGYSLPKTLPVETEQFSPLITIDLISTILVVMGLRVRLVSEPASAT